MKFNLKSIIVGLIVTLIGILLIVLDIFIWKTDSMVWVSIGCSLIASALVIMLNAFLVEATVFNPLEQWKLTYIAPSRAEMNRDCEQQLSKVKYQVDIIAFGLQSFRNKYSEQQIESILKRGVSFRILTMNPNLEFVLARQNEEHDSSIKDSIERLIEWANRLNSKSNKGKIIVKGYSCMTLDFYWRIDNTIYVGPYWWGYDSQQMITYKFEAGGNGFDQYSEYFDKLWNATELSVPLTKIDQVPAKKKKM